VNYDPKDASNVIPEGDYEASIKAVKDFVTDQQGNTRKMTTRDGQYDMLQVEFEVYMPSGTTRKHWAYYAASPKALWRYQQLAKAIGQGEAFKNKQFNVADHIGANLKLSLVIEDNPQYGEQNQISAHAPSAMTASATPTQAPAQPPRSVAAGNRPQGGGIAPDDLPFNWRGIDGF